MLFQSVLQCAILLPALLSSAYPHAHAHERRIGVVDDFKLYPYPSVESTSEATAFATIVLGDVRQDEESGTKAYEVEYRPEGGSVREAMALIMPEETHDMVVEILKTEGTYIASGQDAQNKIWVVVTLSDSADQKYDDGVAHY